MSYSGSLLYGLASWVQRVLQRAVVQQRSYTPNSVFVKNTILQEPVTEHTTLFTADAVSMYTSINTDVALELIGTYILKYNFAL